MTNEHQEPRKTGRGGTPAGPRRAVLAGGPWLQTRGGPAFASGVVSLTAQWERLASLRPRVLKAKPTGARRS